MVTIQPIFFLLLLLNPIWSILKNTLIQHISWLFLINFWLFLPILLINHSHIKLIPRYEPRFFDPIRDQTRDQNWWIHKDSWPNTGPKWMNEHSGLLYQMSQISKTAPGNMHCWKFSKATINSLSLNRYMQNCTSLFCRDVLIISLVK